MHAHMLGTKIGCFLQEFFVVSVEGRRDRQGLQTRMQTMMQAMMLAMMQVERVLA